MLFLLSLMLWLITAADVPTFDAPLIDTGFEAARSLQVALQVPHLLASKPKCLVGREERVLSRRRRLDMDPELVSLGLVGASITVVLEKFRTVIFLVTNPSAVEKHFPQQLTLVRWQIPLYIFGLRLKAPMSRTRPYAWSLQAFDDNVSSRALNSIPVPESTRRIFDEN